MSGVVQQGLVEQSVQQLKRGGDKDAENFSTMMGTSRAQGGDTLQGSKTKYDSSRRQQKSTDNEQGHKNVRLRPPFPTIVHVAYIA